MNILIFEDDLDLLECLVSFCSSNSFVAFPASNIKDACLIFRNNPIDILITDIFEGDKPSGLDMIRRIREHSESLPIIGISSLLKNKDRLLLFDCGADDFIEKPFSLNEILLKLNRWKVHLGLSKLSWKQYSMTEDNLAIDKVKIELSNYEFKIFKILIQEQGNFITRDKILNKIEGHGFINGSRSIDAHISKIRKKIGSDLIKTKRHFGYKLI